jgi:hypothetical protein
VASNLSLEALYKNLPKLHITLVFVFENSCVIIYTLTVFRNNIYQYTIFLDFDIQDKCICLQYQYLSTAYIFDYTQVDEISPSFYFQHMTWQSIKFTYTFFILVWNWFCQIRLQI